MRDRTYSNYFNTQTTVPRCFSINTANFHSTHTKLSTFILYAAPRQKLRQAVCVITLFAAAEQNNDERERKIAFLSRTRHTHTPGRMKTHFNQILHIRVTIRRSKYCRASYQRPGVSLWLSLGAGVHCSVYSARRFFFLGSCGKTLPSIPSRMQSI